MMSTNATDRYRNDLHATITSQRAAYQRDGFPDAATRIDRLERVAALIIKNKDLLVDEISADYGNRSREDTLLELFCCRLRVACRDRERHIVDANRAAGSNNTGCRGPD